MSAARDDAALLQHDDVVGERDRRETVGDDERRAALHDLAQGGLDLALGGGVDRRGGVVEDQDARVGEERAGDRDPLALAAAEGQAALAHAGVVAVRELGDELRGLRARGGQLDLLARRVRARVGDVARDRVREQERSSSTIAIARRSETTSTSRTSAPSTSTEPERGSYRRGSSCTSVVLPDPVAPTSATVEPASTTRSTCLQRVRAVAVAERDVAQLDVPAARRQRRRAAHDARLAIEDLEQPGAGGRRALRHAERDAEHPHRPDQHQQVRVERGEVAEGQRAVDDLAPADQQDHRQPEVRQEREERVEERLQAGGEHGLVEDPPDRPAEADELARLGREGLDDAHAGDVLLDLGGDLADPLLDLLQRRARAAAVHRRHHDDERHGDQGQRRQAGGEPEHRRRAEQDRQPALEDEDQAVAEEEAHRGQVDGGARHQLPGLLAGEEPHLELLQVLVEQRAQVELDRQRDLAGDQTAHHRQAEPHQRDADHGQRQRAQLVAVPVGDLVDRAAGQPRDRDGADHRQRGQQQRPEDAALVGAQKTEKSTKGVHATNTIGRAAPGPARLLDLGPGYTRASHDRPDRPPQPFRDGQGCLG